MVAVYAASAPAFPSIISFLVIIITNPNIRSPTIMTTM